VREGRDDGRWFSIGVPLLSLWHYTTRTSFANVSTELPAAAPSSRCHERVREYVNAPVRGETRLQPNA